MVRLIPWSDVDVMCGFGGGQRYLSAWLAAEMVHYFFIDITSLLVCIYPRIIRQAIIVVVVGCSSLSFGRDSS
jgi:hypothetical protein